MESFEVLDSGGCWRSADHRRGYTKRGKGVLAKAAKGGSLHWIGPDLGCLTERVATTEINTEVGIAATIVGIDIIDLHSLIDSRSNAGAADYYYGLKRSSR